MSASEGRPFFSFVVPVHDRLRYVEECLRSALNQTFDDFEIVVVLDGSPDPTRHVVEHIRADHPDRVRVFSYAEPFGTACRARNTAIRYARGRYVAFLDSDDLADPGRLALTRDLIERTGCDVAYGAVRFLTDEGRRIDGIGFGDVGQPAPFTMDALLVQNRLYTLTVSVRRACLLKHGGFRPEMRYCEDYELWLRLCHRGCTFAHVPDVLSIYRIHGGNHELTFKPDEAHWQAMARRSYAAPFTDWGW
jgi:glycosyltransferase involved in cell wall biosynthesis